MSRREVTVHAADGPQGEGVRVLHDEIAGSWHIERAGVRGPRVRLHEAVAEAFNVADRGGYVFLDQPGGLRFDAMFRRSVR